MLKWEKSPPAATFKRPTSGSSVHASIRSRSVPVFAFELFCSIAVFVPKNPPVADPPLGGLLDHTQSTTNLFPLINLKILSKILLGSAAATE